MDDDLSHKLDLGTLMLASSDDDSKKNQELL
jgi:hypothetical protein